MFDEAVYLELATARESLLRIARQNLPWRWQQDAEDVVQAALEMVWRQRNTVQNTRALLYHVTKRTARKWRGTQMDMRSQSLEGTLVLETTADHRLTPLDQLLKEEREVRLARAVAKLSPAQRRNFEEWVARDYRCETHSHDLKASRVREKLRARVARMAA